MNNTARCPKCDLQISNVHYEAHSPSMLSGYRGSASFTAVAYPCGHALSAVPTTWEMRLEELERINRELSEKLEYLYRAVSELSDIIRKLSTRG